MTGLAASAIIGVCIGVCAVTRHPAVIGGCLIIATVMIMFL